MASRPLEIGAAVAFLGVAAAGWWASAGLPAEPRMMPRLVLALIAISALVWLVGLLRRPAPVEDRAERGGGRSTLAATFALTGAYAVIVVTVGFFIPTLIYIPLMARLLGERRWYLGVAAAVGFAIVAYLLFVVLFERPVPF